MVVEKIEYYDQWIIPTVVIVLSTIFVALGYLENDGVYEISIAAFAVNFLYTLFAVLLLRGLVHLLDHYYPWSKSLYRRFALQMVITLFVYFIIQSFIIFFLNTDNLVGPNKLATIFAAFFIGTVSLVFINSLYLLIYVRHQRSKSIEVQTSNFISGKLGSKRVSILLTDLRLFTINDTLVRAYDHLDRKLILQESLTELEELLDPDQYFRANRQCILTRESIREVIYNDNKSCTLKLLQDEQVIIVSRHKAPAFKKWLKKQG